MALITAVVAAAAMLAPAANAQQTSSSRAVFSPTEFEAAAQDPRQFTIDSASIEILPVDKPGPGVSLPTPPPSTTGPGLPKPPGGYTGPVIPSFPGNDGPDPITTIDRIVNLAQKIFDIIKQNQPVVDVTTDYANAVPAGATQWTDLAGWSQPEVTKYGFYAKNMYGAKVISCTYEVIRQYGGNYKGKGKFLTSVTVQPLEITAAWGYKFSMKFEAPTVSNVGSSEDPVAAMTAKLSWSIDTVLKHESGTSMYYLQGDGLFRPIGGPFSTLSRDKARSMVQDLGAKLAPATGAMGLEAARGATALGWR